jgi:FKBP-type peptidyl-prolyl cis-trans isomerase FklB
MRLVITLVIGLLASVATAQDVPALKSDKDRLSYALGMDLGKQLREKKVQVDPDLFGRGLADALSGNKLLLTDEEARKLVTALQDEMQKREFAKVLQEAEKNKKEGEAFLAANKAKDGVVALESGLQYKILKAGSGRKPTAADTVTCHYRGARLDGTEFDSSYSRGTPMTFAIKDIIKGWSEALQLMPVGSKWQLFVPPQLAYGSRGAGRDIGPNATLVFEVELIAVK